MRKRYMKLLILVCIALAAVTIFSFKRVNTDEVKEEIKQADLDFSELSRQKGMKYAFLEYIDEKGVMLRPYIYPIEGKEKVSELFRDEDDTGFVLTWHPIFADAAGSGELGYTYGLYQLTAKDSTGKETIYDGKYVTIWKKNSEGKWKFVLDTGNPGLKPKEEY